jgi:uncharacterized protein YecE (DUF72 family)
VGRVWIGTSGWSYPHWRGSFYPPSLPSRDWLSYYSERFDCVEVNASFYRLPSAETLREWAESTPDGFAFALKGRRLITHARRLDADRALRTFLEQARLLGSKLHVLLWQLGPTFERDTPRLARFLERLPSDVAHAVEFRHRSWDDRDVEALLQEAGVARVLTGPGRPPDRLPHDLVYVRFHGRDGDAAYRYPRAALRDWASFLARADRQGLPAYAFFNNDGGARAPHNASTLVDLLEHPRLPPRRRTAPSSFRPRDVRGPKRRTETTARRSTA